MARFREYYLPAEVQPLCGRGRVVEPGTPSLEHRRAQAQHHWKARREHHAEVRDFAFRPLVHVDAVCRTRQSWASGVFAGRPRARSAQGVYELWRAWWRTAGGKAEETQAREHAGQRHRQLALAEVVEQEPVGHAAQI